MTPLEPADDFRAVREGCWQLAEPVAVPDFYGVDTLDPDEALSREVGVWDSRDGEGWLPTGRFPFDTTYSVAPTARTGSTVRNGVSGGVSRSKSAERDVTSGPVRPATV